jgi:uncharacterized protein (TIGR03083 family)
VTHSIVGTLEQEWAAIDELLSELPAEQWKLPTALPGWTVHDVVAHIVGGELGLDGRQPPATSDVRSLPHVHNDIAAVNELYVEWLRADSPAQLHQRYRDIIAKRTQTLREMPPEAFDAPSWTPSGQDTFARYMRIRLFDCWMHEQDVRDAVGRPGNESGQCAEVVIDEITAALGYVVGKLAGAPQGSSVTFDLDGPVKRRIHVLVDGRARVVDELPGPATATLTLSSKVLTQLAGGRIDPHFGLGQIEPHGDYDLVEKIAFAMRFTI